jgi:endonuclease-3
VTGTRGPTRGARAALTGDDASLAARQSAISAVTQRLRAHYGEPEPRPLQDPLSELIQTVLSQNTADVNSDRAFASLVARFGGDWEAVRAAPTEAVADAIRHGGLAEIKAARIKSILDALAERCGELDLTFLRETPLEEGRGFLRALGGVGPKTAACVLLFSCGKPAMPVDTHVHRVSLRLGLVPDRATAEQAHTLLEQATDPAQIYAVHMLLIRHGREICKAQRPRCSACPVLDLCPYPAKTLSADVA